MEKVLMSVKLDSQYVKNNYNEFIKKLDDETYINYRWKNKAKIHEYNQTKLSLTTELKRREHLKKILEIGCGPGTWTDFCAERCDMLIAVDISEKMIEIAETEIKSENVKMVCGDFLSLEFDEKFDAVYTIRAFEYFDNKVKGIKKIREVLNKQGRVCIITKNPDYFPKKISDIFIRKKQLRKILPKIIKKGVDVYSEKLHSNMIRYEALKGILYNEGFDDIQIYPVIIGIFPSYMSMDIFEGLYGFYDWIHQKLYKKPIYRLLSPLIESYLITGVKK